MSASLFAPVCSIAPTRRRRFLWAAWWTGAPTRQPFRKPDASEGGARTREEALQAAERAAGCALTEIESGWARAWSNVLVGKPAWPSTSAGDGAIRPRQAKTQPASIWHTLGLTSAATLPEIKTAYRKRALEEHPDRGGTNEGFRKLQAAYESALARRSRPSKKAR
jgi:hypothetical protein